VKLDERGGARSISSLLQELDLTDFVEGLSGQGFCSLQDLLELSETDLVSCSADAGMKKGHQVRFSRWFRENRFAAPSARAAESSAMSQVPTPGDDKVSIHELRRLGAIPRVLRPSCFWDFEVNSFSHSTLITEASDVISILDGLGTYAAWWFFEVAPKKHVWSEGVHLSMISSITGRTVGEYVNGWVVFSVDNPANFHPECVFSTCPENDNAGLMPYLFLGPGARIFGGTFDLSKGSIFIGSGTTIEPGVTIKGPCIIGEGCELRTGAYLRGDVILGDNVCIRCEAKHSIVMNKSELCHPGYIGDSILGFGSHFGCQSLTANLPMIGTTIIFACKDDAGGSLLIDLERRKLGLIMGDGCQLGCNSVTEPGVVMGPRTFVYPLTRLSKGLYGPNELIKNKPFEHGVIERALLR